MKIEKTRIYDYLKEKDSIYIKKLDLLIPEIEALLNQIPSTFPNYTIHNINHSANVAEQMFSLLPEPIDNYNELELYMMLLAAMLHDYGMVNSVTGGDIKSELQDELRKKHHINSKEQIEKLNYTYFDASNDGSGISFQRELALIAQSHGESVDWIKENLKGKQTFGNYDVNLQFIAFLLRLGDLLDFDPTRAPKVLFDYLTLPKDSKKEWQKQRVITNIKKIDDDGFVYFDGSCENPELYRDLCKYFEEISKEIKIIKSIKFSENKYNLKIDAEIKNQIKKIGYDSADLQHKMDYLAISNLLMGDNIYPDKKCALRELLQNAIDACLLLKKIKDDESYVPTIIIRIYGNKFSIEDNGIGMTEEHINNYFLNIGHSYYSSDEFRKQEIDYAPISHYGIGFLSSFMLSEVVTVVTSHWKNQMESIEVDLKRNDKYVILRKNKNDTPWSGTKVILDYNSFKSIFDNETVIEKYITKTFLDSNVKIKIVYSEQEKTIVFSELYNNKNKLQFTDISQYLNDVNCKFHRTPSGCLFKKNDNFLYDDEFIFDNINAPNGVFNSDDLFEYIQTSRNDYIVSELLSYDSQINLAKIYPVDDHVVSYFEQCLDILDDYEAAFNKTSEAYNFSKPIYLYTKESLDFYFQDIEGIYISDIDKEKNYEKKMFENALKHILCYRGIRVNGILIVIESEKFSFIRDVSAAVKSFKISNFFFNNQNDNIFIRNVNIPNFLIEIPFALKNDLLTNFLININSKNCIPDVSRSKLKDEDCKNLGYAIGRAIYIDMLKSGKNGKKDLSEQEKTFIKDFVNKYYPFDKNNEYCKDIEL